MENLVKVLYYHSGQHVQTVQLELESDHAQTARLELESDHAVHKTECNHH